MSAESGALADIDERLREFGWYTVSKKEFRDAIRSRGLWLLSLIFATAFIAPVAIALYTDFAAGGGITAQALQEQGMQLLLRGIYLNMVTHLLPIVAIFVGYAAISKERTSGSLKILLSLPHSRRDVIVGKVLGRCAVLGVPLIIALSLTAVFITASNITFKPELFGLFSLFTVMFALVFVAITVSISGVFEKSSWSGVANFIVYFYMTFLWNAGANGIGSALQDYLGVTGALRWHTVILLKLVNPNQAYKTLVDSLLSSGETPVLSARLGMFGRGANQEVICTGVLNGVWGNETVQVLGGQTAQIPACVESNGVPFVYSDPAVFVFMTVWVGIAAALSYYTFSLADL